MFERYPAFTQFLRSWKSWGYCKSILDRNCPRFAIRTRHPSPPWLICPFPALQFSREATRPKCKSNWFVDHVTPSLLWRGLTHEWWECLWLWFQNMKSLPKSEKSPPREWVNCDQLVRVVTSRVMKQLSTQIPGNLRNEGRIKKEKGSENSAKMAQGANRKWYPERRRIFDNCSRFLFDQFSLKANFLVFIKRNSQGRRSRRTKSRILTQIKWHN